jgi:hypothetical protein
MSEDESREEATSSNPAVLLKTLKATKIRWPFFKNVALAGSVF